MPEFDEDDLHKFSKPVIVRVGQNAAFKMPFQPQESLTVSWFKDGTELKDGGGVKIVREPNHSRLLLRDCLRSDSGEIKIQLKNPFGAVEATSQLIVLGTKTQGNLMRKVRNTERYKYHQQPCSNINKTYTLVTFLSLHLKGNKTTFFLQIVQVHRRVQWRLSRPLHL